MKLVTFDDFKIGVLKNPSRIVDISTEVKPLRAGPNGMIDLIERWEALRDDLNVFVQAQAGTPIEAVRIRAPIARPGKIMCMAANYREGTSSPPLPINGFLVSSEAILEPNGTAILPDYAFNICHHEAELVAIIGKAGRDIPQQQAMDHVFGYTIGVDVSARGAWGFLGKSYDGFKPIGPCIATRDEIRDPHALQVRLSVDEQSRQDYNTSDIAHPLPECISFFSKIMTLLPGDLLFVGTNHQQLGPLQDGEQCRVDIESIGSLTFGVEDPLKRQWPKGIDAEIGARVRSMIANQPRA